MRVIIDTTKRTGQQINSIYHLDILVDQAKQKGRAEVQIAEPSRAVLQQIQERREQYEILFIVG